MGGIVKLTAAGFAKKVKALEVGAYFSFATETDCDGEPQNEEELYEWYGVQKICLFDNEMCVVSKYGGKYCTAFSTETVYFELVVGYMFSELLFENGVYIIDVEAQKQELSAALTRAFCIDIRNCTNCGENLLIPSSKVHDLIDAADEYNVEADIGSKLAELGDAEERSEDELRRMAEIVIDRRDDCDIISEAYWQIVEEVIQEFSAEKKQES